MLHFCILVPQSVNIESDELDEEILGRIIWSKKYLFLIIKSEKWKVKNKMQVITQNI